MFSGLQVDFYAKLLTWGGRLSGLEFEHPGTMFELVFLMELRVVAAARLPHLPEDFEPALARGNVRRTRGFCPVYEGSGNRFGPRGRPAGCGPPTGTRWPAGLCRRARAAVLDGPDRIGSSPGRCRRNLAAPGPTQTAGDYPPVRLTAAAPVWGRPPAATRTGHGRGALAKSFSICWR